MDKDRFTERLLLYTRIEHNPTLTPEQKEAFYLVLSVLDYMENENSKEKFYENIENFLEDSRNSPNFVSLVQQGAANKGF